VILREHELDAVTGTVSNHQLHIPAEGERVAIGVKRDDD